MYNIGSIQKIEIVEHANVESISIPDSSGEVTVTLVDGISWTDFSFTAYTADFEEKEKKKDAGILVEQTLKCKVPKVSSSKSLELDGYLNKKLVVKITDGNGTQFCMGSGSIPVKMFKTIIRPDKASGYNGYEITFESNNHKQAPVIAANEGGGVPPPEE